MSAEDGWWSRQRGREVAEGFQRRFLREEKETMM
jgi:hypothetical protein